MTHVIVTGVSGFLGRYCAKILAAQGLAVTGLARKPAGPIAPGVETRTVDLFDGEAVSQEFCALRGTHLLHAAWHNGLGSVSYDAHEHVQWVKLSFDVVKRFQEAGGKRVAAIGTCAEYDWADGRCDPDLTPLNPESLYGACKHSLSLTLSAFARAEGMSFVWPRVFFVYGPGEDRRRLVASVISALARGETVQCTHGRQMRDYLHASDVAQGLVAALLSRHEGAVDITSGQAVAVRDIVLEIARQMGAANRVIFGARPSPPRDVPLVVGNLHRTQTVIDWAPKHTLSSGIADTIAQSRNAIPA